MSEHIKIKCSKCGEEYEVDMVKPRDLIKRLCPKCKASKNPSGANRPT